jgi:protocatechuate 3,4-dioxygenase beta subunit
MDGDGRQLEIGPTDNTSHQRTPRRPLRLIPPAARVSFAPYSRVQPGLRPNEADMTRLAPDLPRAQGTPIEVSGQLLNENGRPLAGVLLEIWNANSHGRYSHVEDHSGLKLDPHFLGLGRVLTDDAGHYRFWTIKPGAYLARPDIGRWRPKHIHVSVRGGGARLITQMYFAGDPHNDGDPMRILMGDAFARNIGREYAPAHGDVACGYRFDIVVGGRNATLFED